jgi:hypothetical protein
MMYIRRPVLGITQVVVRAILAKHLFTVPPYATGVFLLHLKRQEGLEVILELGGPPNGGREPYILGFVGLRRTKRKTKTFSFNCKSLYSTLSYPKARDSISVYILSYFCVYSIYPGRRFCSYFVKAICTHILEINKCSLTSIAVCRSLCVCVVEKVFSEESALQFHFIATNYTHVTSPNQRLTYMSF